MNKNTGIIIGIIALVVIVGGVYISKESNDKAMTAKEQTEQKAVEEKEAMTKSDVVKTDAMMKAGSYEAYLPDKVMLASTTHDVVLFFRASWCPTC